MKYKLVASDVDGTLVDSQRNISSRTKEMVTKYRALGGIFTLSTGRMEQAVLPFCQALGIDGPVILYNGSRIVEIGSGNVLYEALLEHEIAKKALALLKTTDLDPLVYQNRCIYVEKITPRIQTYLDKEPVSCKEVGDLCAFLTGDITKILIIGDGDGFGDLDDRLNKACQQQISLVESEPIYLEVLPKGASKGAALNRLAQLYGIPMQEVAAVGDQQNDISMVKAAGLGTAMANAHPAVLEAADFVTLSNEEHGVAELLNHIILEDLPVHA